MKKLALAALLVLPLTAALADDAAMDHAGHIVVQPDAIQWGPAPPVLPAGAQAAVLLGDPSKDGPFVIRLSAPDGYKIPPHFHPTTENVTVISGIFHVGTGDKLDTMKADKLGAGGFVSLPAGMHHYAWTEGPTVVQVHGTGPFALTYVNPADAPSAAAATKP
ncbi:MAG TPA: cupin domain-containing protein [Thermoanaerobaculia bacterium]|jgi:anti-sigma factor ChrR (cupin superfamily)|nr:cupin domain-containing protein [Thermoanaerobaculia bacterium]